jgi:hypothetical protein
VGLPFLVVAGAYWLIRRRKSRKTESGELNGSAASGISPPLSQEAANRREKWEWPHEVGETNDLGSLHWS